MKELKDMTTAELAAELEKCNRFLDDLQEELERTNWQFAPRDKEAHLVYIKNHSANIAAYTAELDARCEKAEISIINRAGMNQFKYGAYIDGTNGVWLGIPAVEQHALEGYLLSKEAKP